MDLTKMTDEQLETLITDTNNELDIAKCKARKLVAEVRIEQSNRAALKKVSEMSEQDRAALSKALTLAPQSIEPTSKVGVPGK